MERKWFVFYKSFLEVMDWLPDDIQLQLYRKIATYWIRGEEIKTESISTWFFILMKPQIDANNERYSNWSKWGRPKPTNNQKETKKEPNDNHTETIQEPKEKDKEKEKEKNKHKDCSGGVWGGGFLVELSSERKDRIHMIYWDQSVRWWYAAKLVESWAVTSPDEIQSWVQRLWSILIEAYWVTAERATPRWDQWYTKMDEFLAYCQSNKISDHRALLRKFYIPKSRL
jgi:hypothetical protein